MQIQLDSKQTPSIQTSSHKPIQLCSTDNTQYQSTIVSANESKPVKLFWTTWGYCKSVIYKIHEWVLWAVKCFPSEPSKIEIVEQMIENPKGIAQKFSDEPYKSVTALFQAVLLDPHGVDDLLQENPEEYGEFCRDLKGKLPNNLFSGVKKGPLTALTALFNPFQLAKDTSPFFILLLAIFKDNVPALGKAMLKTCERVMEVLGDSESENEKLNALKALFGTYLPSVAEEMDLNPKAFHTFIDEFYKLNKLDESLITLMTKHFPEKAQPNAEVTRHLKICLSTNALAFRQLSEQDLAKSQMGIYGSIDIKMAFLQALIQLATPEVFDKLIPDTEKDFPLMAELAKTLQGIAKNQQGLEIASENLPRAIDLLKSLHSDYNNPPKKKAKK